MFLIVHFLLFFFPVANYFPLWEILNTWVKWCALTFFLNTFLKLQGLLYHGGLTFLASKI